MKESPHVFLSCEHFSASVPGSYRKLFRSKEAKDLLKSHRGSDIGTASLYRQLKSFADAGSVKGEVTRLLVDLNRSESSTDLFSEFSRNLMSAEKKKLLKTYYAPYRQKTRKAIDKAIKDRAVIHLSLHSFTPVLNGEVRDFAMGILFDPERDREVKAAEILREELFPELTVRYNEPYLGTDDGLCTFLRSIYDERYCGLELELNQSLLTESRSQRKMIGKMLSEAVSVLISELQ